MSVVELMGSMKSINPMLKNAPGSLNRGCLESKKSLFIPNFWGNKKQLQARMNHARQVMLIPIPMNWGKVF